MFGFFRRQRRIFSYWDGSRHRKIDPLEALDAVHSYPGYDPEATPQMAEAGDPEAVQTMLAATRAAFKLAPYDGETGKGLTREETADLLESFAAYLERVKKNTGDSVTPPRSTAATSPVSSGDPTSGTSPCNAVSAANATNAWETTAPPSPGPSVPSY